MPRVRHTGDILTMTAVAPAGTNSQTTKYLYGSGGTPGTNLFSNDVIGTIEYPDRTTGQPGTVGSEQRGFTYNLQGDKATFTDQNGSVHGYNYDVLGRLTADIVTTLGSGVDGSVRALGYSFDSAGRAFQQASYADTALSTVAGQVQDTYNGYGQLVTQYQSHSGAVINLTRTGSTQLRRNWSWPMSSVVWPGSISPIGFQKVRRVFASRFPSLNFATLESRGRD